MMRRIRPVLLALLGAGVLGSATALLGSIWADILYGRRGVQYTDVIGSLAILGVPLLTAYLVQFELRIRIDGRAQLAALERQYPGAVVFTTQAVPATTAELDRIRALAGADGPTVRADHRALTVTVGQYDVSVWAGRHEPRRLALIPVRDIALVSTGATPITEGLTRQRLLPSIVVWLTSGERLLLPVLIVRPTVVKPTFDNVHAITFAINRTLRRTGTHTPLP